MNNESKNMDKLGGEILVVDDTPANLRLLMGILQAQGYKVRPATDGQQALNAVAIRIPELILLDIKMPGIDGYEVCRRLKKSEITREIPIIFISALNALRDRIKGFELGAVDFITKPFRREEVLVRVHTHMQLRRMQLNLEKIIMERTQKLRASEEKYRTMVEGSSDGIIIIDTDETISAWNSGAQKILGYSPHEIIGKPLYTIVPADEQGRLKTVLEQVKESGSVRGYETIRLHRDGREIPVEISVTAMKDKNGGFIGLSGILRDITERRIAEETRILLETAIEQASETIVITDSQGMIQFVNPAFEYLSGYSREEAIGQNPRILQSGRHDQPFYRKMWDTLLGGKPWRGHLTNKKKDGTLYEEDVTISPITKNGQITNFVAVKRDVSKELFLEKQLYQAMKMEAIGTLAGGIAHDFNNILSAIIGYGELAERQLPAGNPVKDYLEQILKAGKRATELTKQILTFSCQKKGELRPVVLQSLVKEVLKLLKSSLPATIRIEENISGDYGMIFADPGQIHQVLMNLCTNAKYAMGDEGGTLLISLAQLEVKSSFDIPSHTEIEHGTYLDLEVSDTGCGMDDILQTKIFDPFFTTKEKDVGTGLGLAVVYGIVKKHHGEITVSSEPGQGSTFHVYLPVSTKEQEIEPQTREVVTGGNERILVVDDDQIITTMLQSMLVRFGYKVISFSSSVEALNYYMASPGAVDLVITDMTMPEMTGAVLAKKLLEIRPDLPIILCTGYSEIIDEAKARSLGIRKFLMKPVTQDQLAIAIRKALS